MKIVIISGSHPRHLYVVNKMLETGLVVGLVLMQREQMVEDTPEFLSLHIKKLYEKHFRLRAEMEDKYFGQTEITQIMGDVPLLKIPRTNLNDVKVEKFIRKVGADCIFSYGPDLLKDNILSTVNDFAFNLHGGLSHWYKGAATMFWPFYFLEPNYVGTTLHYITRNIDSGNIVQHTGAKLEHGVCIHEVACKAIVAATRDVVRVMQKMNKGEVFPGVEQRKNGKLFLERNWRPEHLRLIYDLYEDKIVDLYLDGEINKGNEPKLISVL